MKYLIVLLSLLVSSFAVAQPIDEDVKVVSVTCNQLRVENYMYANVGKALVQGESGARFILEFWVDRFAEDADVLASNLCKNFEQAQRTNAIIEIQYDVWLDSNDTLHKYIVAE